VISSLIRTLVFSTFVDRLSAIVNQSFRAQSSRCPEVGKYYSRILGRSGTDVVVVIKNAKVMVYFSTMDIYEIWGDCTAYNGKILYRINEWYMNSDEIDQVIL
jgi:hypothetical protein